MLGVTREAALATVVQGQNAENLLDFDDDADERQPTDETSGHNDSRSGRATGGLGALDDMMSLNDASARANAPSSRSVAPNTQLNDLLGL